MWQAWHLETSTFVLRGRRGAYGTGLALVACLGLGLVAGDAAALCVAVMALGDIHLCFTWQAWRLETSTFVSPGRRGTYGPGLALVAGLELVAGDSAALCVAGVALGDIHLRFTWQAWHLETSTFVLRSRRGTYGTGLALVARFGWDWSPVTPRHFAWQARHLATSTFVSRCRRGAWRHLPSFHVAGVALMALGWLWWRAWAGFSRR